MLALISARCIPLNTPSKAMQAADIQWIFPLRKSTRMNERNAGISFPGLFILSTPAPDSVAEFIGSN